MNEPEQGWLLEDEQRSPELAQWYSPPDLAARLWHFAPKPRTGDPFRVLEPAAGKGALILPMNILALLDLAERTTNVEIIVRHRDFLSERAAVRSCGATSISGVKRFCRGTSSAATTPR